MQTAKQTWQTILLASLMVMLTGSTKILKTGSAGLLANGEIANFDVSGNWVRYAGNPVISPGAGGAWDDNWVHPVSVMNNAGTYHLYYSGRPTAFNPGKSGLATSSDGLSWTKHPSNPIMDVGTSGAWDDTVASGLCVLKEGASWYGWYTGHTGDDIYKVGFATSADGISWTKHGSNPIMTGTASTWDSAFVIPSQVFKEGDTYYMVYFGGTDVNDQTTYKIGLATSTDRVTWTKHASNPVLAGVVATWEDGVLDAAITKVGATYYMFYQGNTADQNNSAIGIATSINLVDWTRSANNPFPRGGVGAWDENWNEASKLIEINGVWHMYYMGSDFLPGPGTFLKQIGLMRFLT